MTHGTLVLHAETLWASPYVFSSWVALREKGVTFDVREVSLLDLENRTPEYQALTVTARVPALQHDDFCIAESSAIAEYLEEVFPSPAYSPLLPADVRDRARARQLMAWLRSDLGALRDERPTVTMFFERANVPLSARGMEAAATLLAVAEQLIARGEAALFGRWCLADAEFAFMLHRLILNDHALPPAVRVWAERQWQRPSVQAFVHHPRPAVLSDRYWNIPANAGATIPYTRRGRSPGSPVGTLT